MSTMHSLDDLITRAGGLAASSRRILGVTGAPGSGKSTLAGLLVEALSPAAVLVPMDGFHLANEELDRLSRRHRKGAPDTFDATGYVAMLRRLRTGEPPPVYAPAFDRQREQVVAGAIAVEAGIPLVVTEGN